MSSPPLTPDAAHSSPPSRLSLAFAIAFGCLLSLILSGYQVGKSNHTVYLLDAYRLADPALLASDWFTTQTLQYHGLFSHLTRVCISAGILTPVFLTGYLLTILAFHLSAWSIVRAIGGPSTRPSVYLAAIVFLHLSVAGTGLGGFQFLQDGAFLPSNIANVALLAAVAALMHQRIWLAALATGIAGIFHINHAVVAPFVFLVGILAQPNFFASLRTSPASVFRTYLPPALLAAVLVNTNILPALLHLRSQAPTTSPMPLPEFVDLYARLRHPHHYYPPSWPLFLYFACLWSLIPAGLILLASGWRIPDAPRRVLLAVSALLLAATVAALTFAGVVFISERLIQMALFRFTIHLMFLACALTAWGIFHLPSPLPHRTPSRKNRFPALDAYPQFLPHLTALTISLLLFISLALAYSGTFGPLAQSFLTARPTPFFLTALLSSLALLSAARLLPPLPNPKLQSSPLLPLSSLAALFAFTLLGWNRWFGLNYIPEDPPAYLRLAAWAKDNTPKDALFLVPPGEQSFRLAALRPIVINLKAIPQTSAELPEWKRRMQAVTGEQNLMTFANNFSSTLHQLDSAYNSRPPQDLLHTAREFNATYLLTTQQIPPTFPVTLVGPPPDQTTPYRLYRINTPTGVPVNP